VGQLLVQNGNYKVAIRLLKQATILAPEEMGIREHLALAQYTDKNYQDAEIEFARLVKDTRYKTRGDILAALGECQMHLGKHGDARDNFDLATQVAPGIVGNWFNLGKAGLAVNDLRRAELALRKGLSLDNRHAEGHLLMGYLRVKQNRLDEAFTSFRQSSALDPRDPTSLCMLGFVLEKKGRPNEAITYYAKALKLKPNDELATTLMAQVKAE
jgi:tetratricopeptide (TPR) repeat protein